MMKKNRKQIASGSSLSESGQRGMTLIEVLIALAILAAVAVVFLLGLTTSSRGVMVSQKSVSAESLAKSELEYVKSFSTTNYRAAEWAYQLPSNPPQWEPGRTLPEGYSGYSVEVTASFVPGHNPDDGIQKITVIVKQGGTPALTLVGYNVKP